MPVRSRPACERRPHLALCAQVLGRNLEGLVSRAQEQRTQWKDSHVSVEHLVLAFLDDTRFGAGLLKNGGLTQDGLTKAIKEIRGSNRVTDQVRPQRLV